MELKEYILKNGCLEVHVCNLGGIIKNLFVRDCRWQWVDVVLGFDTLNQYSDPDHLTRSSHPGALVGRYADRIKRDKFTTDGPAFSGNKNDNEGYPHEGAFDLDLQIWDVEQPDEEHLILRHSSPNRAEGPSDNLEMTVRYSIEENVFRVTHDATCDQPTPVNFTMHPYFNLNPDDANVGNHGLRLYTSRRMETTPDSFPTGQILPTEGKYTFHFNKPLFLALQEDGLDDCYVFNSPGEPQLMAELTHPKNGITVTLLSDYPGLQVYTGNHLHVANGKAGKTYGPFSGIALEPRLIPDNPHQPDFPYTRLYPGERYYHKTVYSFNCFSVDDGEVF